MAEAVSLTPTSYVVLGLVAQMGPVTAYEMKQRVAISIGYFWPFPHSQLYAEPTRLRDAGLLVEDAEPTGRKRKRYTITPAGRESLAAWLADPTTEPTELRDLGLLKLFFGALATDDDRRALATEQARTHADRHADYSKLHRAVAAVATPWELRTLDLGLRFEQTVSAFWRELAES